VAVRDIPGFGDLRRTVVRSADQCTTTKATATFDDGTMRYSLAAASNETTKGVFNIPPGECTEFEKTNVQFRGIVTQSLGIFTSRVSQTFEPNEPLLTVGSRVLHTFAELIQSADVLEQFHSFVPPPTRKATTSNEEAKNSDLTLDWHTDSGLLLVFTPAQMEDASAGGFMIRKRGVVQEVKFDPQVDLVFMLGDGVRKLVNPKLSTTLDSTVHALKVHSSRAFVSCLTSPCRLIDPHIPPLVVRTHDASPGQCSAQQRPDLRGDPWESDLELVQGSAGTGLLLHDASATGGGSTRPAADLHR